MDVNDDLTAHTNTGLALAWAGVRERIACNVPIGR
jgi:hypothetical protein